MCAYAYVDEAAESEEKSFVVAGNNKALAIQNGGHGWVVKKFSLKRYLRKGEHRLKPGENIGLPSNDGDGPISTYCPYTPEWLEKEVKAPFQA